MMDPTGTALRRLLRAQLTAVNQQFTHILALKVWGEHQFADQIKKVDDVDFPIAIKILDHFVRVETPLELTFDAFTPGDDPSSVAAAERAAEARMKEALSFRIEADHPAAPWLEAARRPRDAYASWLEGVDARPAAEPAPPDPAADAVFSCLIALVEQAMAHAVIHWRRGDPADADVAWATSGVAMLKATSLVRALAKQGRTPNAAAAVLQIRETPESAISEDCRLANSCAEAAAAAAAEAAADLRDLFADIAAVTHRIAEHGGAGGHPSLAAASPIFRSFKTTLDRFGI